jgi:zinc transport system substrate-binding protein
MIRFLLLLILTFPLYAAPKVVVSIKPIHDITLAVMEGVATPTLLVPAGSSPHTYALAPSQAKALYEADLIGWVGPSLETFMTQPLARRKADSTLLTLLEMPGMTLYSAQSSDGHNHGPTDPHLWLDPLNMMNYATHLAQTLGKLDPENTARYADNAKRTNDKLKLLNQSITDKLQPVRSSPLMVFHDAYQYFQKRYQLNVVGTIVLRPDTLPSVAHLLEIQQTLKSAKVQCIFSEPQFKPAIVERLVDSTEVKDGIMDPLGSPSPVGLAGYEALLNNLADSILGCIVS